jgi:hypothetical protein
MSYPDQVISVAGRRRARTGLECRQRTLLYSNSAIRTKKFDIMHHACSSVRATYSLSKRYGRIQVNRGWVHALAEEIARTGPRRRTSCVSFPFRLHSTHYVPLTFTCLCLHAPEVALMNAYRTRKEDIIYDQNARRKARI